MMPYQKEEAERKAAVLKQRHPRVRRAQPTQSTPTLTPLTAERRAICFTCEHNSNPGHMTAMCKVCKCFLMPKTMLPRSRCPIGKW